SMLRTLLSLFIMSLAVSCSAIPKPLETIIVSCDETVAMGKCNLNNQCDQLGYMCDSSNELCCPVVDYTDETMIAGPALNGQCEDFYALVKIPGGEKGGECVSVLSIPGLCPVTDDTETCTEEPHHCFEGTECYEAAGICCPIVAK
ncbi:hypothetical protein PMAYCL1PPCAC_10389, partial [Pristionchus mayeri]